MKSKTESAAAALGMRGSGLGNFSAGAGIRLLNMDIDYAVSAGNSLENVQKISVRKKF